MNRSNRLSALDGLRGAMCLWVLIGHTCRQTGMRIPVLSSPHYAVDGFMILSGFLMTYYALLRSDNEPWTKASTWTSFYIRRYFRISPLYYLLLIAAWLFSTSFLRWRAATDRFLGLGHPFQSIQPFNLPNMLWHVTYAFGLLPAYHASTALPDWSLSLEMQFYLLFPVFMLVLLRYGWLRFALAASAIWLGFHTYAIHFTREFEQPSPLPLSLLWFVIGMVWACAFLESDKVSARYQILLAAGLSLLSKDAHDILLVTAFGWILFSSGRSVGRVRSALSGSISNLLARASYSVYLLHLLILTPIAYLAGARLQLPLYPRFALALTVTLVCSYALARPLEVLENWGISTGKSLSKRSLIPAIREPNRLADSSLTEPHPIYRPLSS